MVKNCWWSDRNRKRLILIMWWGEEGRIKSERNVTTKSQSIWWILWSISVIILCVRLYLLCHLWNLEWSMRRSEDFSYNLIMLLNVSSRVHAL
jgi:hypothetical protein